VEVYLIAKNLRLSAIQQAKINIKATISENRLKTVKIGVSEAYDGQVGLNWVLFSVILNNSKLEWQYQKSFPSLVFADIVFHSFAIK